MIIPVTSLCVDPRTKDWCKLPYPGHPKGCPNYGKKEICPPKAGWITDIIDPPYFLVIQEFDLAFQERSMKILHPSWTKKQTRCLLYWQPHLMVRLIREAQNLIDDHLGKDYIIIRNPEALGVNMYETCKAAHVELERISDTMKIVRKIVIIGKRRN